MSQRHKMPRYLLLLGLLLLPLLLLLWWQWSAAEERPLPVYSLSPALRAFPHLTGPAAAAPGDRVTYQIGLANYDGVSHTLTLTTSLPPGLVAVTSPDLAYDAAHHRLTWQGQMPPGEVTPLIEPSPLALPYLDLAPFGTVNLCETGVDCDEGLLTFPLNGRRVTWAGQAYYQLTVSPNGFVFAGPPSVTAEGEMRQPHWLPPSPLPGPLWAGLWRDGDMRTNGRWHVAVLTGWLVGHDLFYAQWHDAPHAADASLTAGHAIAVVLDGTGGLNGTVFYLYDTLSDPTQTIERGYAIGLADGTVGMTYAYAGPGHAAQGYPPAAGTTLQARAAGTAWSHTFTYQATVTGPIPAVLATTATVTDESGETRWATHYLSVRHHLYLPLVEAAP